MKGVVFVLILFGIGFVCGESVINKQCVSSEMNEPLVMAHRGGEYFDSENILESVEKSLGIGADLIELDIRKSKDDILFCYHGGLWEVLFSRFYFNRDLKELMKRNERIAVLSDVVELMNEDDVLFLDVKDKSISVEDLENALIGFGGKVYFASNSFDYHERVGDLPEDWKRVYNVGLWKLTPWNFEKIKKLKFDVVELFIWDFKEKNIKLLRKEGINVALSHRLLSWSFYSRKCFSERVEWVYDYDVARVVESKKVYFSKV